jgi:hypothetical protein
MNDKIAGGILQVSLPDALVRWAGEALHSKVALQLSPVALGILLRPTAELTARRYPDVTWEDALRFNLEHLAASIVRISSFAVTKWPLLIVFDLAQLAQHDENVAMAVRKVALALANDPTWHRGEWAVFVAPLVQTKDWFGAETADELLGDLLGSAVVNPADLPTVAQVSCTDLAEKLNGQGALADGMAEALRVKDKDRRLYAVQTLGAARIRHRRGGEV